MFCILCNSEEKLYEGLCKSCYLKEFELIKVPEYAKFTVCSHCGATLKHEKWVQTGYYDDEIINDAIHKDIQINDKLKNVDITTEITNNRGTVYECILHAYGEIIDEPIEKTYPIEVKVEKGVCPDCSKFHSGYYEAVIQLRADDRKLDDYEIREADEFIANEIQRICKTNKLAYVTERIVLKEGIDYQVGSYNAAHKIAVNMQKQFGGVITESRKIVGHDKSRSRDLYRTWLSVRLPAFHRNEFIEYEDKILQIKKIGSHKFSGVNLSTNELESLTWKEYDKIKKIGTEDDIRQTTVTNITPTEIQILDPDTYMTVDLKKNESMKNINIGQEINVIKIKDILYIVL
ncbi:60S ribosomal export protein NMD3 [Methanosphaera sp.]